MTRDIDSATIAASSADLIRPIYFLKLQFDSGNVLVHSELGDITWGGDTYSGVGQLGAISGVVEDTELGNAPVTVSLSGLPGELISLLFNEQYQGRVATIFMGYKDGGGLLVADPIILFRGIMDSPTFQQDSSLAITMNLANRFAKWDNPLVRRYNDADQQSRFPGDKGFEFVAQTTNLQIVWGQALPT